jgi:hypothetical protein
MSIISNFPGQFPGPTLDEMVIAEINRINTEFGRNSFFANRHIELMQVGSEYVWQYFANRDDLDPRDRERKPIGVYDVLALDPYAVAQHLAPDLDLDRRAGIANTVYILVQHARTYLEEMAAAQAVAPIMARPILHNQVRTPLSANHAAITFPGRITIDLVIHAAPVVPESGSPVR